MRTAAFIQRILGWKLLPACYWTPLLHRIPGIASGHARIKTLLKDKKKRMKRILVGNSLGYSPIV